MSSSPGAHRPELIAFAEAIAIPDYPTRRRRLRTLAGSLIQVAMDGSISVHADVIEAINIRNKARGTMAPTTMSGFRDLLHEDALTLIIGASHPELGHIYAAAGRVDQVTPWVRQAAHSFHESPCGLITSDAALAMNVRDWLRANVAITTPTTTETDMSDTATAAFDDAPADSAALAAATEALVEGIITLDPAQESIAKVVNTLLARSKIDTLSTLIEKHNAAVANAASMKSEIADLRAALTKRPAPTAVSLEGGTAGTRVIPSGRTVERKASALFGTKSKKLDFDVTTFEWDAPHPDVPEIDPDYVFREAMLMRLLYALMHNKNPWLWGHTGTGKTTLVEQVAARLGWPVMRVNFDSDIDRMALIGKETLTTEGEGETRKTVTKFVEGALPMAMQGPYIFIADEVDRVRPDIAYVFQSALESKGLTLLEDGGGRITPHPMFRMVGTANTNGQIDESGLYSGARPQSSAFMNRWTVVIEVPYLSAKDERTLIKKACPGIDEPALDSIMAYVVEHRKAFDGGEVSFPLSPRATVSLGEAYNFMAPLFASKAAAMNEAMDSTILGLTSQADRVVLKGLADRTLKLT